VATSAVGTASARSGYRRSDRGADKGAQAVLIFSIYPKPAQHGN
jgi:hypothetical protein